MQELIVLWFDVYGDSIEEHRALLEREYLKAREGMSSRQGAIMIDPRVTRFLEIYRRSQPIWDIFWNGQSSNSYSGFDDPNLKKLQNELIELCKEFAQNARDEIAKLRAPAQLSRFGRPKS
jgi:hypothetical protein